ncbi:MAG TPA: cysteine desulfurase family protein [Caldilineaceae bacterium]|nr:cysteine desulfurase family protein [Caldilineaceae bacterium]
MNLPRPTIYLDHSATTPVAEAVLEAMLPYFTTVYGNPSSIHKPGRQANAALEKARRTIAEIIGARPGEIVFTSGGSEGDNAALRGLALARRAATGANRILVSAVEHHAVLHTAEDLHTHFGFELTILPVDEDGLIHPAEVERALGDGQDVALVSVMYANNEIGTIQPISAIGALCRAHGVPLHTDAVQAVGKLPLSVESLQVDALSTSAHKFYGPKGVGFLYLRRGVPFQPILTGGSHEHNRRAGTENVPLIVGMAKALELAEGERIAENARLRVLRDRLIGGVLESVDGVRLTGSATQRLDCHASFVVKGVEAEGVLIGLDLAGIAASSGSACTSAAQQPSHVLTAIGVDPVDATGGLRFTLGRDNTPTEIDYVLARLPRLIAQIRQVTNETGDPAEGGSQ